MALPLLAVAGALLLAAGAVVATASPALDSEPGEAPQAAGIAEVAELPDLLAPAARFVWPTGGPVEVWRAFEAPGAIWLRGHRGVDLRHPAGAPVVAAADGVIAFAGLVAGRGVVSIRHDDGIVSAYEPVEATVRRGDVVRSGEVIGTLVRAGSHCAPEPCLHWGARRGPDDYVDPMTLLQTGVLVRLYPDS